MSKLLNLNYRAYLIDLDGTVHRGQEAISSAVDFVELLIEKHIPYLFLTNNATRSLEDLCSFLQDCCSLSVKPEHFYTSTMALLDDLKDQEFEGKALVIGEAALINQVKSLGIETVDNADANVVIQGLDRQVNYDSLSTAVQALNSGAAFLVTNQDRLIPSGSDLFPSSGAITAFLAYATQRSPKVFGKPEAPIIAGALDKLGMDKEEVLLIGDNYETDILAGINFGLDTLLVLTGVTTASQVPTFSIQPTYVLDDLSQAEVSIHE